MRIKFILPFLLLLSTLAFLHCKDADGNEIVVPAGSHNALVQAILSAGNGGSVRLESGLHTEDAGVVINQNICLIGDPGAILQVNTHPRPNPDNLKLDVALYVLDVSNVCIEGIDIRPVDPYGGTAILLENAPDSRVSDCTISRHEFSIVVQKCDRLKILNNHLTGVFPLAFAHGIVWINGVDGTIKDNQISNCFFGIWPCDEAGTIRNNHVDSCLYGVIPCKVVKKNMTVTPRSDTIAASITASGWTIEGNEFYHNQWGMALADESNHCTVQNNSFHDNGIPFFPGEGYDIELIGESKRFGPEIPLSPCHDNTIKAKPTDKIKNCSPEYNDISGGMPVDISASPCF